MDLLVRKCLLSFCYFFPHLWIYFQRHLKSDTLYLMSSDKVSYEVLHVEDSVEDYNFLHLHFSLSSLRLDCEKVRLSEA